jgi:hypothetical protein
VSSSEQSSQNKDRPAAAGRANAKRPYQKPAFQHEHVFETMALACGKTNPVIQQCNQVKKNS